MSDWNDQNTSEPGTKGFMTRWVSRFFKWLRNFFALIGFMYTVLPIALIWFFTSQMQPSSKNTQSSSKGKDKEPRTLWLSLDTRVLDSQPKMGAAVLKEIFGGEDGIYIPDLRSTFRAAGEDSGIKDVQIVIDGLSGSLADLEELRQTILEFRQTAKKPVKAWVHHMDNAALLISSATDKVALTPVAEVMIPGPAFPQIYAGDAIRKLGVDLQVVRAGKYKSAFESLIANEPSAESKEMMSSLESSLRNHLVTMLAEGRKKQPSETFLWLKESVFTAAKAKELGIVDELAYVPTVDFEDGVNVTFEDYAAEQTSIVKKGYSLTPERGLALIEASGEIVSGQGDSQNITPSVMQEELEWARTNKDVAAVVLRVASPGGSASASDEIWEYVRRLNAEKPVIASFGSVAASGGYYISAGARKIVADATTITGSIGVIGLIPSFEPFKDKYGITFPITTQSNRAAMLSGGKKMTAEDHKYIGDTIDETYRTFKSRVAEGRKIPIEKVESLAQGRVYSGLQALDLGLVDQLGSLKDALKLAKKEAGLDENKLYPVFRYEPEQFSLSECLSSIGKLKKCFRRHGAQLKTAVNEQMLGDDAALLKDIKRTRARIESKEKVLALYLEKTSF